ncbi:hypothetical protein J1N35_016980 [Gossypium stocksii]|uniref:CCT domain-containing protein n=1 Tax=Gossypium stocksii TaxID=47602 RepID=A0A9D4A5B4_9ROSI|nr:hypothetical protein J1N35_016980 [Gossypium stocksii]
MVVLADYLSRRLHHHYIYMLSEGQELFVFFFHLMSQTQDLSLSPSSTSNFIQMSYNLSVSDNSSFNLCIPEMFSTDTIDYDSLFNIPFYDSSFDYNLQALSNNDDNQLSPVNESSPADQLLADLLPSNQLENLSLCQTTQFPPLSFGSHSENPGGSSRLEVKNEECQVDFDSAYGGVHENDGKYLQRSFSSNCFEGKSNFSFKPPFDSLMESQSFQGQASSLPETSFFTAQMRKVSSTGDLESMRNVHNTQRSISTSCAMENTFMEESGFKVGRYNAEERQERISKYRAKRSQRNFNKTIKYACRKTLADTRPRIRGRFARNDETVETPKLACSTGDEGDDLWGLLHEVGDEATATSGTLMNNFGQYQFQFNHGCF